MTVTYFFNIFIWTEIASKIHFVLMPKCVPSFKPLGHVLGSKKEEEADMSKAEVLFERSNSSQTKDLKAS